MTLEDVFRFQGAMSLLEDWDAGGSDGAGGGSHVLGVGFTATGQERGILISFCWMDVCGCSPLPSCCGFSAYCFFFFHTRCICIYVVHTCKHPAATGLPQHMNDARAAQPCLDIPTSGPWGGDQPTRFSAHTNPF